MRTHHPGNRSVERWLNRLTYTVVFGILYNADDLHPFRAARPGGAKYFAHCVAAGEELCSKCFVYHCDLIRVLSVETIEIAAGNEIGTDRFKITGTDQIRESNGIAFRLRLIAIDLNVVVHGGVADRRGSGIRD